MKRYARGMFPRRLWPEWLRHPYVEGIFVGGCVERGVGSSFRAKAHAHVKGSFAGWICFRKRERLEDRMLCLHELAHVITREGHTKNWRACVLRIGGTLDATESMGDYHERPRRKGDPVHHFYGKEP